MTPTVITFPLTKLAVTVVTNVSVWKILNDVVRNNVSVVTPFDAARVWTGTMILGGMIADQATKYAHEQVDRAIEWNEKRKTELTAE